MRMGDFPTLTEIFGSAKQAASGLIQSIEDIPAEWTQKVNELKAKASEFGALLRDLDGLAAVAHAHPEISGAYDALMSRGRSIKNQITSVTQSIDNVYKSASALFGLAEYMGGMGQLGALPLIPIAVIVGAIALITMWLADAYTMRNKLVALQAAGASAEQITRVSTGSSGGLTDQLKGNFLQSAALLLVVGAVVLVGLPALRKALSR